MQSKWVRAYVNQYNCDIFYQLKDHMIDSTASNWTVSLKCIASWFGLLNILDTGFDSESNFAEEVYRVE